MGGTIFIVRLINGEYAIGKYQRLVLIKEIPGFDSFLTVLMHNNLSLNAESSELKKSFNYPVDSQPWQMLKAELPELVTRVNNYVKDIPFKQISSPVNLIQDSLNGVYLNRFDSLSLVKFEPKKKSLLFKNKESQHIGGWGL